MRYQDFIYQNKINGVFNQRGKIIMSSSQGQNNDLRESQQEALEYQWQKRWLKGPEYAHMLKNMDGYCKKFGFKKYQQKTHPKQIYSQPINGMIYFVKGKGVGQDFGFPRMQLVKKKYRWKKMNFTTDLPKRKPCVTYVVASAMRAHLIEEAQNAQFRMHAVIPYCDGHNSSDRNTYILCHVRSVDHKKEPINEAFTNCFVDNFPDFYRLFAFLHNYAIDLNRDDKIQPTKKEISWSMLDELLNGQEEQASKCPDTQKI